MYVGCSQVKPHGLQCAHVPPLSTVVQRLQDIDKLAALYMSAMLHYFRIVAVDNDLVASGSTFNLEQRTQAHTDLVQYASLAEEVSCKHCIMKPLQRMWHIRAVIPYSSRYMYAMIIEVPCVYVCVLYVLAADSYRLMNTHCSCPCRQVCLHAL